MTHFIAKSAITEIPHEILELVQNCYKMLNSSKKAHNFANLQCFLDTPKRKICRLVETRWLSLEEIIKRIIEQWYVLLEFSKELANEGDVLANKVNFIMQKLETKCFLYLLQYTLKILNNLNKFFQRRDIVIYEVKCKVEQTYKDLVSCILERNYVLDTAVENINVFDTSKYLRFVDFELGEDIRECLRLQGNELTNFCKYAFTFIIVLTTKFKKYFHNFDNPLYKAATCLKPSNALSISFHEDNKSFFELFTKIFFNLIRSEDRLRKIKLEWAHLLQLKFTEKELSDYDKNVDKFWKFVYEQKNEKNEYPFRTIGSVALIASSVPHGNADTERLFSDHNNCKTKNRNKLSIQTVDSTLRTRNVLNNTDMEDGDCEPSEEMIATALGKKYF